MTSTATPRPRVILRAGESINLTTGVVTAARVAPAVPVAGRVSYVHPGRPRTVDGVTFTPAARVRVIPTVPTGPTILHADRRSLRLGDAVNILGAWWVIVARPTVDSVRVARPVAAAAAGAPLDPFAPHGPGVLSRVVQLPSDGRSVSVRRDH